MNQLVRKSAIYLVGTAASKIVSAALIPLYAFRATKAELGQFDLLQTTLLLSSPIVYVAVWEAVLRFGISESSYSGRADIAKTALLIVSVGSFVGLLGIICIGDFAGIAGYDAIMLFLMLTVTGTAQVWQGFSRAFGDGRNYVISGIVGTFFNFAALVFFALKDVLNHYTMSLAYVLGQVSIIMLLEFKVCIIPLVFRGIVRREVVFRIIQYSSPLALNLFFGGFVIGFGRILVATRLGVEANGEYAFAMKFAALVSAVGSVVGMASVEEGIVRRAASDMAGYFSLVLDATVRLVGWIAVMALGAVKIFYFFLSGSLYANTYFLTPFFVVFALGSVVSTSVGAVFQATDKTFILGITTFFSAIVTGVLSLLVVEPFEVSGIGFALAVGTISLAVTRWVVARTRVAFKVRYGRLAFIGVLYIVLSWGLVSFDFVDDRSAWRLAVCFILCGISILSGIVGGLLSLRDLRAIPDFR